MVRTTPGEAPEHVLVLRETAGPRERRRGRAAAAGGSVVPLTVATVIAAAPVADPAAEMAGAGPEAVDAAFAILQSAVHGHRVAAADPYVAEVAAEHALVVRLGYGSGEQVAEGRWTEARELPRPRRPGLRERRMAVLRPQERLAALLGGREAALACEELVLRGRLDLDRGRGREAALQAHLALEAARVELAAWSGLSGMGERLAELDAQRSAVAAAADAALQGGLDEDAQAVVERAVERVEAALRARAAGGAY